MLYGQLFIIETEPWDTRSKLCEVLGSERAWIYSERENLDRTWPR